MAYLSHDAWEAQLQHKAPRAILDSYNRGYDAYQEENVKPQQRYAQPQRWASPSESLRRERRLVPNPVSPLEEADAQFERRATVKAAHAMKQDLEDMLRSGLKAIGGDAREAKAATDYLKGDMELRRREYQETQRSC